MLKPIDEEWIFTFIGKDIDTNNDLPKEGIGTGSKAIDVGTSPATYIFVEDDKSWNEVTS